MKKTETNVTELVSGGAEIQTELDSQTMLFPTSYTGSFLNTLFIERF